VSVAHDTNTTLRTIADQLGLHSSTVSRVLNGTQAQAEAAAGADTREQIRAAARALDYQPNPWGASLRTNRSNLIGVLVPRLKDYVLASIYEGIQDAAAQLGYYTMVTNTREDPAIQAEQLAHLISRRVDGVVFGDSRTDSRFLDDLEPDQVPFVLVNRHHNDLIAVTCDDYAGGRMVGEHLLEIGRTDVAILAGSSYATTALDRSRGMIDVFAEAGVEIPADRVLFMGFDAPAGRQATEYLLQNCPRPPQAIFNANDFGAIATMGVLRDCGLAIPGDVAVVGYNDVELAAETAPSLTTIRSPMHEMGAVGMRTLAALINGEAVESQRLMPTLVVRQSTVS
jgi:LacI family transcriptional regulator